MPSRPPDPSNVRNTEAFTCSGRCDPELRQACGTFLPWLFDISGVSGALSGPSMFRVPAYDPVALAVMGIGIPLAAALAFQF
jgi:hypothetical protein